MVIQPFLFLLGTTVVISISGALMPGPVFAVTVVKGRESRYSGALVAIGHAIIEFPLIALVALGMLHFIENTVVHIAIGIIGGVLLMAMAYEMFKIDVSKDESKLSENKKGKGLLLKHGPVVAGFLTSISSPYFFLWWATIGAALVMTALHFGVLALIVFAIVHWSIDLFWLLFVGYSVNKSERFLTPVRYRAIFIGCGLLLVVFGIWFVGEALFKLL